MKQFAEEIDALEGFEPADVKKAVKATQKATGQKGKKLFMPIRVAVTGQTHGPELPHAISLLGPDVVKTRLRQAVNQYK